MIDLSIIIPVYNSEKFIKRCVYSVLNAIEKTSELNVEVIIINDGSTDNTLKIINKIIEDNTNNHIRIISQKNKGVYFARNVGLANANGKAIWMIDSDDYISEDSLKEIENKINASSFDVIAFGYQEEKSSGNFVLRYPVENITEKCDGLTYLEKNDGRLYLWNYIYNTNFIKKNNLYFLSKTTSLEDSLFNLKAFIKARKVIFIKKYFYYYTLNTNSISKNHSIENLLKLSKSSRLIHEEILKLLEKENIKTKKHQVIQSKLNHSVLGYFYSLMSQKYPIEYIKKNINEYKILGLYPVKKSKNANFKSMVFRFILNRQFLYLFLCRFVYKRKIQ